MVYHCYFEQLQRMGDARCSGRGNASEIPPVSLIARSHLLYCCFRLATFFFKLTLISSPYRVLEFVPAGSSWRPLPTRKGQKVKRSTLERGWRPLTTWLRSKFTSESTSSTIDHVHLVHRKLECSERRKRIRWRRWYTEISRRCCLSWRHWKARGYFHTMK